jgi:hypothetical protein
MLENHDTLNESFEIVKLQIDDSLMLENKAFADLEEKELKKAKLMFKTREKLIIISSIKFNEEVITLLKDDNNKTLILSQSKQFDCLRLIVIFKSIDLIESRDQIRKSVTSKDQYVTQRVRDAYIAIMTQFETSFDLFVAAQIINLKEKDAKRLNQRLQ